jgi:hypothetical protein
MEDEIRVEKFKTCDERGTAIPEKAQRKRMRERGDKQLYVTK